MYKNRNLYGLNWNNDDLVDLCRHIIEYCEKYYSSRLVLLHGDTVMTTEIRFLLKFNSYGATHMVVDWISQRWKQSPEELGYYMTNGIPEKLMKLMELDRR